MPGGGTRTLVVQRNRPFALAAAGFALSWLAVILPILTLLFLVTPENSPINYNGARVPIGEVRVEALTSMLAMFVFAVWVGPGLWQGKPLARHVAFSAAAGLPFAVMVAYEAWDTGPWLFLWTVVVAAYLYAKPNVCRFFSSYRQLQLADR